MVRINKIIRHKLFDEYIKKIKVHEQNRIFCKHDTSHFLDVCRLAEIDWMSHKLKEFQSNAEKIQTVEEFYQIDREWIYAAGLLHDIGRWQEYETGIRHEIASVQLAPHILKDCEFSESEIEKIVFAIVNHRNSNVKDELSLAGILYRADKKSRPCYFCEVEKECNWSVEKKNLLLK